MKWVCKRKPTSIWITVTTGMEYLRGHPDIARGTILTRISQADHACTKPFLSEDSYRNSHFNENRKLFCSQNTFVTLSQITQKACQYPPTKVMTHFKVSIMQWQYWRWRYVSLCLVLMISLFLYHFVNIIIMHIFYYHWNNTE